MGRTAAPDTANTPVYRSPEDNTEVPGADNDLSAPQGQITKILLTSTCYMIRGAVAQRVAQSVLAGLIERFSSDRGYRYGAMNQLTHETMSPA